MFARLCRTLVFATNRTGCDAGDYLLPLTEAPDDSLRVIKVTSTRKRVFKAHSTSRAVEVSWPPS